MNLSGIGKSMRQYPVLFVCGGVVLLLLVLLFMRGPKVNQYDAALAELDVKWRNIQTNLERSTQLEQEIEAIESGLERIRGRLMSVEDVAVNYEFFYGLERDSSVTLVQFSQDKASDGEALPIGRKSLRHFSVIPYDLQMRGTLPQLLAFVESLERQDYIVRIDLLRITRPLGQQLDFGLLEARMRCHVLAHKHE